jgi:hypothetical protein
MRFLKWGKRKDKAPEPKPTPDARPSTGAVVVARSPTAKVVARSPTPKVVARPPVPKEEPRSNGAIHDHLYALSPTDFEHAVARLLPLIGYTSVRHTGGPVDDGVDIECKDAHGGLVSVQCKRYAPSRKVTKAEIATFFGRMVKRHARQGIYVTTSTFTSAAIKEGLETDIRTIDGDGLATLFARHPAAFGLGPLWEPQGRRTSFDKECRYCGRPIQIRQMPDGKWRPFDDGGTLHDCPGRR